MNKNKIVAVPTGHGVFVSKEYVRDHAHWEYDPNANDWGIGGWCCSKCHYKNDALGIFKDTNFPIKMIAGTKFCGNCGAVMDEEVDDS